MHREPGSPEKQHKAEPAKPPVFAPLDAFTVNLQQEDTAQFAQVGLTLRMTDEAAISELKVRMPEVRDRILLMLSAKKAAQLLSVEGKRKLAEEIRTAVNTILAPDAMLKIAAAKAAERAAAAKRKPGPAEGPEGGAEGEPAEAAEAAAEPTPRLAPIVLPVTGVLFTSFIIQ
jgi:flagellar basal body-associated protein FliL